MKKILIVDDSALMRRVLSDIIQSDSRFTVTATANNGLEALELLKVRAREFDAVMLDINMPKMTGLELLLMLKKEKINVRVIMVSTVAKEGAKETITALERGAFDFVTKPEDYLGTKDSKFKNNLIQTLCVATGLEYEEIFDEKSVATPGDRVTVRPPKDVKFNKKVVPKRDKKSLKKLVTIISSTGGPKALHQVVPKIPGNIDAPILLVQHMPKGFTQSLAARLDEISEVKVKEAEDGDVLQKGCVYIAPGGKQMKVRQKGGQTIIMVVDEPAREGLKPCANIMYESLVGCDYDEITCAVLTGMGADGTLGIGALCEKNNTYIISQDKDTCVVYGMPKAIYEANIVDEVRPLDKIAEAISKNVGC